MINISLTTTGLLIFLCLMIWSIAWKGIALWKSSQHNQKIWFIAILFTDTLGILEIVYLKFFQKDVITKNKKKIKRK